MAEQALIKTSKFKVGDYITAPNKVYLKVVCVIDGALGPMYGIISPKYEDLIWNTQYELDTDKVELVTPDFNSWDKLAVGDIIHCGQSEDRPYVTVLLRAGNAVLLSRTPNKALASRLRQLDEVMKGLTESTGMKTEDFMTDEDREEIQKMGSQLHSSKMAGDWMAIETLALMHWEVLGE